MSMFCAAGLTAGYGGNPIINELSFSLEKGRLLGILGANGSGKTTLLKSICGILPCQGSCTLDGAALEHLSARQIARTCSYIPQRSGISIDIPALDVVLMGFNPHLGLLEHPGPAMKEKARNALALVGLREQENTNYLHLSEGQKQLCILARTLVSDSKLLLMDEPESALDFHFRYRLLEIIRSWIKTEDRCAIVTLHDPALALNYCDELLLLKDGRNIGIVHPTEDPPEKTEELLNQVYGPVSLTVCRARSGKEHLVMLNEQEVPR